MALPAIPNKGRRIRRFPLAAGETFVEGAPVLLVAGEVTEAGADPATILGFAAHDAVLTRIDPDPGFSLVYVASPDSTFFVEGTADPRGANIGTAYDVDVDANGVALIDPASVAAAILLVEDIYLKPGSLTGFFEVSVLAANRQFQV
jgi:hypothetical protein